MSTHLRRDYRSRRSKQEQNYREQIYAASEKLGSDRPLIVLARMLRGHLKDELPWHVADELYWRSNLGDWLYDRFKHPGRPAPPIDFSHYSSALINAIADISSQREEFAGVKAIINYNFDDLVEKVMRERGTRCTTISAPSRIRENGLQCYHVHGVLPFTPFAKSVVRGRKRWRRSPGDFVFSEEEYHRQYAEPFRWSNLIQTSTLGAYDGLFIGLSLEDPNIRRLLDATHRQYPGRRNYAVLRRARPLRRAKRGVNDTVINVFEQIESDTFDDIGLSVLWIDDFKEIPSLLRDIAAIPQPKRRAGHA